MKKLIIFCTTVLIIYLNLAACVTNHDLNNTKGINFISECTYEIVILKPDETNSDIMYETELPWDLVDISYRNDKFIPLGTAFAIAEDRLLTASHVLDLYSDSKIYKKRFIREKRTDKDGNKIEKVYELDKIYSINNHKDYVLFSVKNKKFDKWLNLNTDYQFNSKIYTAGNALGEGIVIRDGILLDKIPEREDGNWDYLKSSILTNPGNSGGPLLNESGEVLGVVISKKDDFCYALPVSEIMEAEGLYHSIIRYEFAAFNDFIRKDYDYDLENEEGISLPIYYEDYIKFHTKKTKDFNENGMAELFAEYQSEIFPNGNSSVKALHTSNGKTFPQILLKDSDVEKWFYSNLDPYVENMENNGRIRYSPIYKNSDFWLIEINQPEDIEPFELYQNPKKMMDYFLSGISLERVLFNGDPGTRIISYGEPMDSYDYKDQFMREWSINTWLLEYCDDLIIFASTPTPKGLVSVYLYCSSSRLDSCLWDLEKLLSLVAINYYGKVKDWESYLNNKNLISDKLAELNIKYIENEKVILSASEFNMTFNNELFDIEDDNQLFVSYDFFKKNDEVIWDIRKIVYYENNTDNYFLTYRYLKPEEVLSEQFQIEWDEVLKQDHPFTRKPYIDNDGNSKIGSIHPIFLSDIDERSELFSLLLAKEEKLEDETMIRYLENMESNFMIRE